MDALSTGIAFVAGVGAGLLFKRRPATPYIEVTVDKSSNLGTVYPSLSGATEIRWTARDGHSLGTLIVDAPSNGGATPYLAPQTAGATGLSGSLNLTAQVGADSRYTITRPGGGIFFGHIIIKK